MVLALALGLLLAAGAARAEYYPYEATSGATGLTRSNNIVDVTAAGACSATVGTCAGGSNPGAPCNAGIAGQTGCNGGGVCNVGTTVTVVGCRNRAGSVCSTGAACDLARVPQGRCSYSASAAVGCLWPNGAGFCANNPNIGCLDNGMCASVGGTCNLATNVPSCACQGTNAALADFESVVCGVPGVCSDGDGNYSYAPVLHGGVATSINLGASVVRNAGAGAGSATLTGPRSDFENPPVISPEQRAPGLGELMVGFPNLVTPIVETRTTAVFDIGPAEPSRGGIRKILLKGDSFWQDIAFVDSDLTSQPVGFNGPTTFLFRAPGPSVAGNPPFFPNQPVQGTCAGGVNPGAVCVDAPDCPGGGTCVRTLYGHQAARDAVGYVWTQAISPGNAALLPPTLDIDADGQPDSPPHTGLDYDLDTLEQMALEAVDRIDPEAGAQLAFDALQGTQAGAGDAAGFLVAEVSAWAGAGQPDMRCFIGGEPSAVCATCAAGLCGSSGLACVTDGDCQTYVGRCASATGLGSQPCDPLDNGTDPTRTDCPVGQSCHACFGPVAVGACVGGPNVGLACRVVSDCPASVCGIDVDAAGTGPGLPAYNDLAVPPFDRGEVAGPNPWGLPVGYNTYGIAELALDTRCNGPGSADDQHGRIGLVAAMPGIVPAAPGRTLGVPFSAILTTGKAGTQSVDPDVGASLTDDAAFGQVTGGQIGIAEPGMPGVALSGGSFAAGRIFPVGGTCCDGGGNVLTTKNVTYAGARANTSPNASGAITWGAGTQGTVVVPLMRSSGWRPGSNRVPGCIGDNAEVPGGSAFPDPGPCNDALGTLVQNRCTGDNCTDLNTGADDLPITASVGGATIPVIAARAKVGHPLGFFGVPPLPYAIASSTVIDVDALGSDAAADFAGTLEAFYCPLAGHCLTSAAYCVLDSNCPLGGNLCVDRVLDCGPIIDADFDFDGILDIADDCPTVPNLIGVDADPDGDEVNNACDNCRDVSNPPFTGATTNRTRTGGGLNGLGQLDDDADGRGNRCDMDYNQAQAAIGAPDTNLLVAVLAAGRTVDQNLCGPGGTSACGIHDLNGGQNAIGAPDTNIHVALLGAGTTSLNASPNRHCGVTPAALCSVNPNQACCSPFSRAIEGVLPGPTLNKAICRNATGVGAPQRCVYPN